MINHLWDDFLYQLNKYFIHLRHIFFYLKSIKKVFLLMLIPLFFTAPVFGKEKCQRNENDWNC